MAEKVVIAQSWSNGEVGKSGDWSDMKRQFLYVIYQKDTLLDKIFVELEKHVSVKREQIVYFAVGLMALYLIFGRFAEFVCNLIGFGYPAYASVKAIRSETKEDDTQWLVYWTVFASFTLVDFFAEWFMSVLPFYWLIKAPFLLYLALPQTKGAITLYRHVVNPLISKLDENLEGYSAKRVVAKEE